MSIFERLDFKRMIGVTLVMICRKFNFFISFSCEKQHFSRKVSKKKIGNINKWMLTSRVAFGLAFIKSHPTFFPFCCNISSVG